MPAKRPSTLVNLPPATIYRLMVGFGTPPAGRPSGLHRLRGWVAALQLGLDDDPRLQQVWDRYGAALIAEATAAGFVPWGVSHRRPSGAGFDRWQAAFLDRHTY